ncbi:MAG: replicative DNA helicase [bacterium]
MKPQRSTMPDLARETAPGGRTPPHNLDAERAILGAVLLERDALGLAREQIKAEAFYRKEHRLIFDAMCSLYERDQAIDAITVAELLDKDGVLAEIGGTDCLTFLAGSVGTAINVVFHAKIVREKATLRQLISEATIIATEAYEGAADANDILDKAQSRIYSITEATHVRGFESVNKLVPDTFKSIEEAFQSGSDLTGLRTSFGDLDRMLGGMQSSDLLILAARPSMGKTSLALNIAYNVAVKEKEGVAIFSLEMAREQLVMRLLCSSGGFNLHDIRRGKLKPEDWPRLTQACERLSSAPIYIDDSSAISVLEMKAKARRLKQQHGLGLVIIDYLQLMSSPGRGIENRQQEISAISRNLKGLAKDLGVPVLALSQLSRAVETRGGDHRPILSDLRESGSIEQDADVVMFIFREEVYKPDDDAVRNLATLIIGKQRNGPTGSFDMHFHKNYTRFTDLMRERGGAGG